MLHDRSDGGLRKHVRSALKSDHDRVDAKFGCLDIQDRSDLATFLQTHRAAFHALLTSGAALEGRIKAQHLKDLIQALEADLSALHVPMLGPHSYCDLAVDHIVLGSRLGTAILRDKWLMSQDRQVRQARSYFAQPQFKEEWRGHCMHLSLMQENDVAGQHLIEDARRLFVLFESAL
ncbi:unnamed protein product, partial [Ectocarpus sp. 12 AP-2014]